MSREDWASGVELCLESRRAADTWSSISGSSVRSLDISGMRDIANHCILKSGRKKKELLKEEIERVMLGVTGKATSCLVWGMNGTTTRGHILTKQEDSINKPASTMNAYIYL